MKLRKAWERLKADYRTDGCAVPGCNICRRSKQALADMEEAIGEAEQKHSAAGEGDDPSVECAHGPSGKPFDTARVAAPAEAVDAEGVRAQAMLDCVRWIDDLYWKAPDEKSKDACREASGVIIEQLGEPRPASAEAVERVAVFVAGACGEVGLRLSPAIIRSISSAALSALQPSAPDGWRTMDSAPFEAMQDALWQIKQWCEAYPLKVFTEPDFAKAAEALATVGITLDAMHGTWARHLLEGVNKIATAALPAAPQETKK